MSEQVNHKNILALHEVLKTQQGEINLLKTKMGSLINTISNLQEELTITKALAAYSRGTGATK